MKIRLESHEVEPLILRKKQRFGCRRGTLILEEGEKCYIFGSYEGTEAIRVYEYPEKGVIIKGNYFVVVKNG